MPSRHSLKQFTEYDCYHLYNRGVDKHPIFHEDEDYRTLLSYMATYLSPKSRPDASHPKSKNPSHQ